jgi:hypothetical protein
MHACNDQFDEEKTKEKGSRTYRLPPKLKKINF